MEWYISAIVLFTIFLVLLFFGMRIGIAFAAAGMIGFLFFERGLVSLPQAVRIMHDSLLSYGLLAIPLFILMAEILEAGGANQRLYAAVQQWFRWLPGSLPVTSIITCGIFGAACGSSVAATASLGKLMLAQMMPRGIHKELVAGTITAGGSLSLLIPPSLALILFGALTQASVGKLFIGAIIPGVIQVILFSIYIVIRVVRRPELAPAGVERLPWRKLVRSSWGAMGVMLVIAGVMGSIYTGVCTPNEAGAIGISLAIIIGVFLTRELTWSGLTKSLLNTLSSTGLCIFLLIGAQIFTRLIALQGIGHSMSAAVVGSGLNRYVVIFFVTIMYIVMGMLMDGISITVLTVPIFVPILVRIGWNEIWIGVYVTMLINIGLLTPPVGLNAYIVGGIGAPYGIKLSEVFRGSMPFVYIMALTIFLVILFPSLILWLPATMR
jgi:C4-dicarboxylate transporter DctM subunit